MSEVSQRLIQTDQYISELIGPELAEVVYAIRSMPAPDNPYLTEIPDPSMIDNPVEVLAALVAKTSNNYSRVARFAGMARAETKLAKGRFERKFKRLRTEGKNDKEREANAYEACQAEHMAMTQAEAIAEMADALQDAARISSESARKLYDKANAMIMGNIREMAGYIDPGGISPY